MQNVCHKNKWNAGLVHLHVEPPPIPLIKIKHDDKMILLKWNCVGIRRKKIRTCQKSKWPCSTTVIGNIVLFGHNFKRNLKASGTLHYDAKIQYLCKLVRREALHQFDMLSADFESSTPLILEAIFWYWVCNFSSWCAVKEKARNVTHNEEAKPVKGNMIRGLFDWP